MLPRCIPRGCSFRVAVVGLFAFGLKVILGSIEASLQGDSSAARIIQRRFAGCTLPSTNLPPSADFRRHSPAQTSAVPVPETRNRNPQVVRANDELVHNSCFKDSQSLPSPPRRCHDGVRNAYATNSGNVPYHNIIVQEGQIRIPSQLVEPVLGQEQSLVTVRSLQPASAPVGDGFYDADAEQL